MAAGILIRGIEPAEYDSYLGVGIHAFNSGVAAESFRDHELITFEFDRSVAALDGDEMVGTSCVFSLDLSVPGGSLPCGGISAVAVLPTYRRRGILSAMMDRMLADISGRGEPVSALFASEPEIYGRYGYGCATSEIKVTIPRGDGRIVPAPFPGQDELRLRIADPASSLDDLGAVYDTLAAAKPGLMARDKRWWQKRTDDPEWDRHGRTPLRCLIAEDDSGPRGYALFASQGLWGDHGIPSHKTQVWEIIVTRASAAAALWSHLMATDLVGEVSAPLLAPDDPLLFLLSGMRRARPQLMDGLWIRLIDLPAALARRRYACAADVVIEVSDRQLPGNAGRWRFQADSSGRATCTPTRQPADLLVPVQALGAAYLGGISVGSLAAAGQVREEHPGAVRALSAAMSWDVAPWCPMIF